MTLKRETVVEIFVVLAFIGGIAAYVAPKFRSPRNDGAEKQMCAQTIMNWHTAMQSYKHKNGQYPYALNGFKFVKGDELLVSVLGEYTNVTENLEACASTVFTLVEPEKFVITVNAKDNAATPFQAVFP